MYSHVVKTTKTTLTIHGASSAEAARRHVLDLELCPDSAILSVTPARAMSLAYYVPEERYWQFALQCTDHDFATPKEARAWLANEHNLPLERCRARWASEAPDADAA